MLHCKVNFNTVKSKISSKGQITLPKRVREVLGLELGEEVTFEIRDDEVLLKPRRRVPLEALRGCLKGKVPFPGEKAEREAREKAWGA